MIKPNTWYTSGMQQSASPPGCYGQLCCASLPSAWATCINAELRIDIKLACRCS